jgi:predicted translin family RNA/ssDNA-binding protein
MSDYCDRCATDIKRGAYIYCEDCFDEIEGKLNQVNEQIAELKAKIEAWNDMANGWLSIEKQKPPKCERVLIYASGYILVDIIQFDINGIPYVPGEFTGDVTHWRPLPEPPKESEG